MDCLFDQPRPLITTDRYGGIHVDHETLQRIKSIPKELVIVGVVGLCRTGKSYLMNRLAGKSSGFALGNTIDSHTKGIWIWGRQLPGSADKYMLLLDTEGLGDVSKAMHDNILQGFLNIFSTVTELSHLMVMEDSNERARSQKLVPELLVALRDFCLELEISGSTITSDQYLEDCLQVKQATSSIHSNASAFIRRYFVDRRCFTLDRPVETARKLKKLDGMKDSKLSDDFLKDSTALFDYIYRNGRVKLNVLGNPISGEEWFEMTSFYVSQVQKGRIVDISQIITSSYEAMTRGMEAYENHLRKVYMPLPDSELNKQHTQGEIIAVKAFKAACVDEYAGRYEKDLREKIRIFFHKHISDDNSKLSHGTWSQFLASIVSSTAFSKNIAAGTYIHIGGYRDYSVNLDRVIAQYNVHTETSFGDQKERALSDFLIEQVSYGKAILDMENELRRIKTDSTGINVAVRLKGFSTVQKVIFFDSTVGCQIKCVDVEVLAGTCFCCLWYVLISGQCVCFEKMKTVLIPFISDEGQVG